MRTRLDIPNEMIFIILYTRTLHREAVIKRTVSHRTNSVGPDKWANKYFEVKEYNKQKEKKEANRPKTTNVFADPNMCEDHDLCAIGIRNSTLNGGPPSVIAMKKD